MRIGGVTYAAKCFYFTGNDDRYNVDIDRNLKELRNELLRQSRLARTVKKFLSDAEENNISVYGKSICPN